MVNKETRALNDTLDQMDLTDIFRTLYPKATEYTFFWSTHGTFSKIETSWVTKQPFISIQELRSYHAHFQTHNAMKLEINHRKKSGKPPKAWRLKNTLLKNEWVNQAIREEIKKYVEINKNENTTIQMLGMR